MLKLHLHRFFILLLLLAFSSQTFAVASMTCELEKMRVSAATISQSNQHHAHHTSSMENHDMSEMVPMEQETPAPTTHQNLDCCKTMGHCLLSNCSFAATDANSLFLFTKSNSTGIDFYSSNSPTPLITSLFRPPIFA